MTEKVAIVTGISRGIGYAIAKTIEKAGYSIWGVARHTQAVAENHPHWHLFTADLTNLSEVDHFATWLLEKAPRFDVLIHNAGGYLPSSILQEKDDTLLHMLHLNFISAYRLTQRLLPRWIQQKGGLIIQIASIASVTPYPQGTAYATSKAALWAFGRNLRETLKPYAIGVTNILLGATLTDSWAGTPLPPDRFIAPEDVATIIETLVRLPQRTVVEEITVRPLLGDIA